MTSTKEAEATARAYGAEAMFFAGMAHNMMLEDHWREVANKILGWLNKHDL